jgi:hypothetical protein
MHLGQKKELLQRSMTPLSPLGPIYEAWHDAMVQTESLILRQMGFTLYWISDSHPHCCIDRLCGALSETVKARAHEACDRTYYTDACVRFRPEVIAHAAVFVACRLEAIELPSEWGEGNDIAHQDVADLCNWVLGVSHVVSKGSFNDPGGLVWDFTVDFLGKS